MTTTGLAIRQRLLRETRGALGLLGKTTADAGGTDRLRDALRWNISTRGVDEVAGAFLRVTQAFAGTATATSSTSLTDATAPFPGSNELTGALVAAYTAAGAVTVLTITSDTSTVLTGAGGWSNGTPAADSSYLVLYEHVAQVVRVDPDVGDLYFDPPVTPAVVSGTAYELWFKGIWPDMPDEARDAALRGRCSPWRTRALSVFPEVADWSTAAYASSAGGVTNAAAEPLTLAFPERIFDRALLVTNSGANGYCASPSAYVQPTQSVVVFGRVAARAQTASVRLRDISNGADITLSGTSSFTLRGQQWFVCSGLVPSGCGEIQLWLGGASASCVGEWSGVGCIIQNRTEYPLVDAVLSRDDVGPVYEYLLPTGVTGTKQRQPVAGVRREQAGDGVTLLFDAPPVRPVYFRVAHRYAALQADYMTAVQRATGDAAVTDCDVDYAAWAAAVELLELGGQDDRTLKLALKNLNAIDARLGADPMLAPQFQTQGIIPILSL